MREKRLMTRTTAGAVLVIITVLLGITGCGAGGGAQSDQSTLVVAPPTPSPSPSPTATPSPPVGVDCAGGAGSDGLTAYGATLSAWNAHHEPDPDGRYGSYGPVQNDGLDRYTNVLCTATGRIDAYAINVVTGLTLVDARAALRRELPADAQQVYDTTIATTCEVIGYRSSTLARVFGPDNPRGLVVGVILDPASTRVISLSLTPARVMTPPATCE